MIGVSRVPVVQQVVDSMKEYIAEGQMEVGQKLPTEKEWCEKLGVGRGTVREAFRTLEAKGLVEIKPGRGAFLSGLKEMEQQDIVDWFVKNEVAVKDFIDVRSAIEPLCVRLVCEKGEDAELDQIEKAHHYFIRAVGENSIADMAKYDERFHRQIVEASRNSMLLMINKKIDERIKDFRYRTFQVPQNAQNAIKAHQNIVNALKERDGEVGELYAKRHIHLINVDMDIMIKK